MLLYIAIVSLMSPMEVMAIAFLMLGRTFYFSREMLANWLTTVAHLSCRRRHYMSRYDHQEQQQPGFVHLRFYFIDIYQKLNSDLR